ncbi:MAG TPA: radical SAM protein [Gemmatimonadaceae bacterium]
MPLRMVNWVVKVSKLCNLRCRYCYEWNELHRTNRIELSEWEHLLSAIRKYHERRSAEVGGDFKTTIIWHGGEPLLLPLSYMRSVFEMQHQMLGGLFESGAVVNALQSNLYRISDDQIALLKAEKVQLGVSCDVVGGVRLSLGNRETEEQVVRNMDRVRAANLDFGAITVLAAHTVSRIIDIYDFYESLGVDLRVLPLFAAPLNTPDAPFALATPEAENALKQLFLHWVKRPKRVRVLPIDDCIATVLRHRHGSRTWQMDRTLGEWAFIVNTDGNLFEMHEAYDDRWKLGNIFAQSIDDVLASPAYLASFARDKALATRVCSGCRWKTACSMLPAFDGSLAGGQESRCNYSYALCNFIDEYFTSHDFSVDQIAELLPVMAD